MNPASQSARCERCVEGGTAFAALAHSRWRKFTLMREAGLLLPRADKSPVEPRCIHHMLALLEGRLGRGIKARFWEDRLRWPRNTSQCRRRLCRCAKSNGAACAAPAMKGSLARGARPSWRRLTTPSPLPTDRPSGHGIAYTLSYARLAEPLSQCKKAFSDLSDGSTVSAEPKPLYSQPSGNSASTAALCATARPCTVGLRVRQSRRGSCRHSTRHERSLASMVLAARPSITCGTTTFRRRVICRERLDSIGSPCLKPTPTTSFCAADRAELLPDKRPPYDRSTPLPAATDAGWGVGVDRDDTRDW